MSPAFRKALAVAVGAALLMGLTASPLSAAKNPDANPDKIYGVAILPTEARSGADVIFTAKVTNLTKGNSSFNSFSVSLPTGFTPVTDYAPRIVEADSNPPQPATVAVAWSGATVEVTGLDPVRQDRWVTVEFKATVKTITGCADQQSDPWPLHVWTGSDLSGSEFALTPPSPLPTTTITVDCGIEFATQPQDAVQGQTITGTAFDPLAGKVTVVIKNNGVIDTTVNGGPVTLTASALTPGLTTFDLAGATASFVNGVATFDGLSIADFGGPAAGKYQLLADYSGYDATSDAFVIYDAYVCGGDAPYTDPYSTAESSTVSVQSLEDVGVCFGITVASTPPGNFGTEEWTVTKSGGGTAFKGYLTFVWTLDETVPIPWTEVTWTNADGTEVPYHNVQLCNPGVDYTDPLNYEDEPVPPEEAELLFPLSASGLGYEREQMCLADSSLDGSTGTWIQTEIVAYNADLGGRRG